MLSDKEILGLSNQLLDLHISNAITWLDILGIGLILMALVSIAYLGYRKVKEKPRQDEADAGTVAEEGIEEGIVLRERCRRRLRRFRFCAIISDCLESSMCWTGMEMI